MNKQKCICDLCGAETTKNRLKRPLRTQKCMSAMNQIDKLLIIFTFMFNKIKPIYTLLGYVTSHLYFRKDYSYHDRNKNSTCLQIFFDFFLILKIY